MSFTRNDLPYTRKRLEDLASALRVNSAYLWVNPANNTFGLRDLPNSRTTAQPAQPQAVDEDDSDESV